MHLPLLKVPQSHVHSAHGREGYHILIVDYLANHAEIKVVASYSGKVPVTLAPVDFGSPSSAM